ncbi:MAG: zf-TFIIB domain-containing protein [Desulfuromonadaceae bacterium]
MQCVKCNGELQRVTLGEIEVDKCVKCSGIWFDIGELDKILESSSIDTLKNEIDNNHWQDALKGKCPRCGGTGNMVQVTSLKNPDIHIDTCSVCYGQWLDGGEIEELTSQGFISKIKGLLK